MDSETPELNASSFLDWARQFINSDETSIQQLQDRRTEIRRQLRTLIQTIDERHRELIEINHQLTQLGEASLKLPSRSTSSRSAAAAASPSVQVEIRRITAPAPKAPRPPLSTRAAPPPADSDSDDSRSSAKNGTHYDDLTVVHMRNFLKKKGQENLSTKKKDELYAILQENSWVRECCASRSGSGSK